MVWPSKVESHLELSAWIDKQQQDLIIIIIITILRTA